MYLAINGGTPIIPAKYQLFPHPQITNGLQQAILGQLNDAISIYDNGGIYEKLESRFREYFGLKYVLSVNSGTTALFSMYYGANLQPGDEVVVPAYTFFATATPLFPLGVIPILADADDSGNIDPRDVADKISPRTKAVVVTHMWGIPCDMQAIRRVCMDAGVLCFEDCSHAHGATYYGEVVGAGADGSAWSLQGKKILSAGEGGILATTHREIYERAILVGHFNKRARKELTLDLLRNYATTGSGLNFRMHPLGAALAYHMLIDLDEQLREKREVAEYLSSEISKIDGLSTPRIPDGSDPSWYAFPILFDKAAFPGITKSSFVQALRAEGAVEADIPISTCPLTEYEIFRKPEDIFPQYLQFRHILRDNRGSGFSNAKAFHEKVFKLPVWYGKERMQHADYYLKAIHKVINLRHSIPAN
jgi:perosamine synthetase